MTTALHAPSSLSKRLDAAPTPLALLAESAQRSPDHPALQFLPADLSSAPHSLSYQALYQDVLRCAAALQAMGVADDESVAILLPFVPQAVISLIAASSVAVAFPMNLLLSPQALRSQLTLARCKVVITLGPHPQLDVHARVLEAICEMPQTPQVVTVGDCDPASGALDWQAFIDRAGELNLQPQPERVATLIHTGGTTGEPKLARLSQHNLAAGAWMAAAGLGITPHDRLLSGLPLFHVGGTIDALLNVLAVGATVVFPTPLGMRNPTVVSGIWTLIERYAITLFGAVPTSLASVADVPLDGADLTCLRAVMTGGAPLPRELSGRLQRLIGKAVCQLYGMTESSGIATAQNTGVAPATLGVGSPVPLMEVALGKPGCSAEPGARGEVLVRGPNVFHGYLTPAGVSDDPQGSWFASGDIGEVDQDGQLQIVGRIKDVIIRSGHNIDPLLIEEAALTHPEVAQAAAVAMPDEYAGELPLLFVVLKAGQSTTPDALEAYVAQRIAEPPARAKRVIMLDQLPLTPFAKVARYRLRQLAVEHRVNALLAAMSLKMTAHCRDTQAKHVTLCCDALPPRLQRDAIVALLARLNLRLNGFETTASTGAVP